MYRFYLSLSTSDGFSETAETIACPVMAREKQEPKEKKTRCSHRNPIILAVKGDTNNNLRITRLSTHKEAV